MSIFAAVRQKRALQSAAAFRRFWGQAALVAAYQQYSDDLYALSAAWDYNPRETIAHLGVRVMRAGVA